MAIVGYEKVPRVVDLASRAFLVYLTAIMLSPQPSLSVDIIGCVMHIMYIVVYSYYS